MANPTTLFQIRHFDAARAYNPLRDIVVLMPRVLEAARQSLEKGHLEPWAQEFFARHGLDEKDLAEAYLALAKAIAEGLRWDADHPSVSLENEGYFAAPPAAKLAVFARVGMAVTSMAHFYLRQASLGFVEGQHIAADLAHVVEEAEKFLRLAKERSH